MLGDFVMQESFIVWDPKAYFKKGRERQVFLFELCVVFAKKIELSTRAIKYVYKSRLMVSADYSPLVKFFVFHLSVYRLF